MKSVVCFLLFSLSLCAFAKAKSRPLTCPADPVHGGQQRVARHEFKLKNGERILICTPPMAANEDETKAKYITQYDAYLFSGKKKKPVGKRVLTGSLTTPVRFELRKGELFEIIHLNVKGDLHELYREKIVCSKGVCKRKDKTCVFNQYHISPPSPKDLEREKIIYSKGAAQVQEMTEADLAQMSTLALSGRKKAFEFFTEMQPRPILIGPSVTFYENMQSLLMQMKSEGCLKIQAQ